VLIGAKGTRLRPLHDTVPKVMVTLRNKPYIQYMGMYYTVDRFC
jgi:NDP-sugar pyrophosphorylase family protein